MCFDICTINIRVSIRVRGLHLVFLPTARTGLHTCACHLDCTTHAPGVSWHKPALNKKSHRYRAFTSLMGGEYIQHWPSPPTYQAQKRHQYVMLKPPHTALQAQNHPGRRRNEARDILATAAKNQTEDGPSTRRAAIRASKYLRAMFNQHGPLIQSAHEAAKIHTQRSKGSAATAMQYRPKEGELPVIAPELTSELLHCLSTLPDPWPLAKITIDMEKPSQWVSKMCRLFFADEYARRTVGVPTTAQVPDLEPAFKATQNILPKLLQELLNSSPSG